MKIIVCGGRNYKNKKFIFYVLDEIHKRKQIEKIVAGDATGVDTIAIEWAISKNIEYKIYKASWDLHGKAAGPIRNEVMIKENNAFDLLVAFSGGRGTKNALSLASKYKIKILNLGDNNE